jgi:hypothetical protein
MQLSAYMSIGNSKSVDIVVQHSLDTNIISTIDVKAVRGYSSFIVNNVKSFKNHFICLVCYNDNFSDIKTLPEFFIVPSGDISIIQKEFKEQKRIFKKDVLQYKDAWHFFTKFS